MLLEWHNGREQSSRALVRRRLSYDVTHTGRNAERPHTHNSRYPGVGKHYIGPVDSVGQITLFAGTSALSATRRGPDPNQPTRWAILWKLALTCTPDPNRPKKWTTFWKTGRQGPCWVDVVCIHIAHLAYIKTILTAPREHPQ